MIMRRGFQHLQSAVQHLVEPEGIQRVEGHIQDSV